MLNSNKTTKNILEQTKSQANEENDSDSESSDEQILERQEQKKKGLISHSDPRMNSKIDHWYFNRKVHEIR